jgi:large subunit ribosomal protein L24
MPLDISNVALIDPSTDKVGKVGYKINEDGKKVRYFKKTGATL